MEANLLDAEQVLGNNISSLPIERGAMEEAYIAGRDIGWDRGTELALTLSHELERVKLSAPFSDLRGHIFSTW